jgi:hypothetical protein
MKNTIWIKFLIGVFFILIMSGCNNKEIKNQTYPKRYKWANLHVSINDLISCDKFTNYDEKNQCYYKVFEEQLPLCNSPQQQKKQTPIKIDIIAKNCSIQQKNGFTLWWLWGWPSPIYKLHNNIPIQTNYIWWASSFARDNHKNEEILCKISLWWDYWYDFATKITQQNYQDIPNVYHAILSWLESNLISYSDSNYYDYAIINCGKDSFCKWISEWWHRSDTKWNYIMNWYSSDWYYYYIINGKLYDPWISHTDSDWSKISTPNESRRLLWSIKNNKIMIYKMINLTYTDPYVPKDKNDFNEGHYNTYTLKTCEIDL